MSSVHNSGIDQWITSHVDKYPFHTQATHVMHTAATQLHHRVMISRKPILASPTEGYPQKTATPFINIKISFKEISSLFLYLTYSTTLKKQSWLFFIQKSSFNVRETLYLRASQNSYEQARGAWWISLPVLTSS